MGYLGQQSSFTGTQNNKRISVTATSGQVNFLPAGGYNINAIDVYRNGVKLVGQRDFVALDGITVTLLNAANQDDILEFVIYENFAVTDALTSDGDQVVNGNFQVSGDLTIGGILNATVQSTIKSGIATEAVRAGMSTEATRAGMSTEATRAGIATEAVRAGISSVAVSAGIATFATTAGVSTSVSGFLGVGVTGTNLNVTGVITANSYRGDGSQLTGIAATANVNTSTLVVAGMSTLSGNFSVAGVSTFTGTATFSTVNITQSNPTHLRVTGFSTLASVTSNTITVSGVSTLGNTVVGGATTQLIVTGNARVTGILTIGTGSVTLDGTNDIVQVGTAITMRGGSSQIQVGTGVTISGTHLSIAGIMTVGSIGAAIGKNAIGNRTVQSGGSPSGGSDGDIYYIY